MRKLIAALLSMRRINRQSVELEKIPLGELVRGLWNTCGLILKKQRFRSKAAPICPGAPGQPGTGVKQSAFKRA